MIMNKQTGEQYQFHKDADSLNEVFTQYQIDYARTVKGLPFNRAMDCINVLLKLNRLYQLPSQNYMQIRELMDDFEFKFPLVKFYFYATINFRKAEQIKIVPELFTSIEIFHRFLSAVDAFLKIKRSDLKQRTEGAIKPAIKRMSCRAAGYAILFEIRANGQNGTLDIYFEKWSRQISKDYKPIRAVSIELAYHNIHDNENYHRKNVKDIQKAILILKNDTKAILQAKSVLRSVQQSK